MKKGDIVDIYQRPYTKEDFEGKAKLVKKIGDNPPMEYWEVEFSNEKGTTYQRWILKEVST